MLGWTPERFASDVRYIWRAFGRVLDERICIAAVASLAAS
jgi:hypothetical protein